MSQSIVDDETGEVLGSVATDAPVLYSFYTPHDPVVLDCGTELITKQEFKAECDINTILYQYSTTGILSHVNQSSANFLDLPDMSDFQFSLNMIMEAEAAFASLPSVVRDRYGNDAARFLGALSDPSQRDYLTEVGVFRAPVEPVSGLARPGDAVASRTPSAGDPPASAPSGAA